MGFDQPKSLGSGETGGGVSMPIWINYMREALDGKPQAPLGPIPDGLSRINGDYYYNEFPPGVAIERVGLPSPMDQIVEHIPNDGITNILQGLRGQPDDNKALEEIQRSFIEP